jgi:hypothetical protein
MKSKILLILVTVFSSLTVFASPLVSDTIIEKRNTGPYDTIVVRAVMYNGELVPFRELEDVWVSNLSPRKLEKAKREYYRLRNAVYVTYPYARQAGKVITEINLELADKNTRKSRKEVINAREEDLRAKFTEPLTKLSVYQGKVLMKILNRQTGNNCYDIIKEYKGGFNARVYQTVAFFFGSSLKQDWDLASNSTDRDINNIIKEIHFRWYGTYSD